MKGQISNSQFARIYSRGQLTIPKEYRDYLGIYDGDWLKVALADQGLLLQPIKERKVVKEKRLKVKPKIPLGNYLKKVVRVKGLFGAALERDNKKIRAEVEEKLTRVEF